MEERLKQLQRAQRSKFQFAEERAMEKNSLRPRQAQQGLGEEEMPDELMPSYTDPAFGKINQPRVAGSGAPEHENEIAIPKNEFVREHKSLVELLKKAGKEGVKQEAELKKVNGGSRHKRSSHKPLSRADVLKMLKGAGMGDLEDEESDKSESDSDDVDGGAMAEAKKLVPLKGGAKKAKVEPKEKVRGGAENKRSQRGQMISKLMKEKKMSLPEASRYIKEHNLI